MVLTIFRSRLRNEDMAAYAEVAVRMQTLAAAMPGFIGIKTFQADDGERVSLVEFESKATMQAWRQHPEHRRAQEQGRTDFYSEYQIQVCSVIRQYGFRRPDA